MADREIQQQGQPIRSGYFNRDAFRKKSHSLLVLQTGIAGLQFHVDDNSEEGRELLSSLTPGTELRLFREPDNEHDRWAISVYTTEDKELGYVTRFKNETIARLMDLGKVFHAYVDEPADPPKNEEEARRTRALTENYKVPFSIYMDD